MPRVPQATDRGGQSLPEHCPNRFSTGLLQPQVGRPPPAVLRTAGLHAREVLLLTAGTLSHCLSDEPEPVKVERLGRA